MKSAEDFLNLYNLIPDKHKSVLDDRKTFKLNKNRNWTVLLIGGASGMGKSSIAYELARFYNVNVMEVDDVYQAVKAMTTREVLLQYITGALG